jgi:hypothetical protein
MTASNPNIEHLTATIQEKFGTNDASKQALQGFHAESAQLLGHSNPQIFGPQSLNADFKKMVDQVCGPFAVLDGTPQTEKLERERKSA